MQIGIVRKTVGDDRPADVGEQFAHDRIVDAHHGKTVERQAMQEFDERRTQLLEVVRVSFEMIGVDVGDRRDHRSEEHTSELQSLMRISYAVFCLKKKNITNFLTSNYTLHNNKTNTIHKQFTYNHITNIYT